MCPYHADLPTGHLGGISFLVQKRIHGFGLFISRSRLRGGLRPPVWQCGCHSRAPWPSSGQRCREGRRPCRLGRAVLFSTSGAFWKNEKHQNRQCALLEATSDSDLPTSRPGAKGKRLPTSYRDRGRCCEGLNMMPILMILMIYWSCYFQNIITVSGWKIRNSADIIKRYVRSCREY